MISFANDTGLTNGNYKTEEDAVKDFVGFMSSFGEYLDIYQEVDCLLSHVSHYQYAPTGNKLRADILIVPKMKFVEDGFKLGAIVIEIKKSNVKVGPPLSQLMDYMKSSFVSPRTGVAICPSYGFLFPFNGGHGGTTGSLLMQQRVGGVSFYHPKWQPTRSMDFMSGHKLVLKLTEGIKPVFKNVNYGKKTGGSR